MSEKGLLEMQRCEDGFRCRVNNQHERRRNSKLDLLKPSRYHHAKVVARYRKRHAALEAVCYSSLLSCIRKTYD
jgi:hypothetical protein